MATYLELGECPSFGGKRLSGVYKRVHFRREVLEVNQHLDRIAFGHGAECAAADRQRSEEIFRAKLDHLEYSLWWKREWDGRE